MKPYLMQIRMSIRLTMRNRAAFVFGYGFPLVFFFLFGSFMGAGQSAATTGVVTSVLTLGAVGSGLFGAALQAVMNREQNILRRFKVAPITAGPIMVSAMVGSLFQFIPMSLMILVLANRVHHMPWPAQWPSLLLFISIGVLAIGAIGNIIAAVVNSVQEAQIVTNIFYLPMVLVGGATIPLTVLPHWVQIVAQFLPSYYLSQGMQGILRGRETILDNLPAVGALLLATAIGTLLAVKLFRWEKEEKMKPAAKFWIAGVMTPFLVIGVWESRNDENQARSKSLQRDVARNITWLIRDTRIFTGDSVIDRGSVLVKNGKITTIYTGAAPDPKSVDAQVIEGAGKTLLPGLIDMHVHLTAAGVQVDPQPSKDSSSPTMSPDDRALAAYLYSGVTAVKSLGDPMDEMLALRTKIGKGEMLGAELFAVGPMFTTEGGHGTEFTRYVPAQYRDTATQQVIRMPKTPEEATAQVHELKQRGVDGIKAILDAGAGTTLFHRMDVSILKAVGDASRSEKLPLMVHTGNARDVADALAAGAQGIEHGSTQDRIPEETFRRMKASGVVFDPTLAVWESIRAFVAGNTAPLERSLVQQVLPQGQMDKIRAGLASEGTAATRKGYAGYPFNVEAIRANLAAAYRDGVTLIAGTDSGNPMLVHGPALHRELQLWVEAGVPPAVALQAATLNAARALGVENRIGAIREGLEASVVLVDGNPLEEIAATERISTVLFKGERINRQNLFDQK